MFKAKTLKDFIDPFAPRCHAVLTEYRDMDIHVDSPAMLKRHVTLQSDLMPK